MMEKSEEDGNRSESNSTKNLISLKMHPRNIYNGKLDFVQLGEQFPLFKKLLRFNNQGKAHVNFKDHEVLRVLCEILLERDFQLKVDIPQNYLVPRLPVRLNYILWIEDLLQVSSEDNANICGIDIGCGPVAIYCLLAHKKNNWEMKGTDINFESIQNAKKIVDENKLEDNIEVIFVDGTEVFDTQRLFKGDSTFSFTMCNPPFFSSKEEAKGTKRRRNAKRARPPPQGDPTGVEAELIVEGGELTFIEKQIEESKKLKTSVWFFTTMIGVKAHMKPLVNKLKAENIKYTTTEFCQGRTMRWGLAWTFTRDFPNK